MLFAAVWRQLWLYSTPGTSQVIPFTHSTLQKRCVVCEEWVGSRAGTAAPQGENTLGKISAPGFLFER